MPKTGHQSKHILTLLETPKSGLEVYLLLALKVYHLPLKIEERAFPFLSEMNQNREDQSDQKVYL